jgi:DNA-directed RNA polymerase specialized sigma subunit
MSMQNLENFNFEETKKNVNDYFRNLEKLEWEYAKLNARQGVANRDISAEYQKQPYIPIDKDTFNLSAKELTEEKLRDYISTYYWAKSILADKEQLYIDEYFVKNKQNEEVLSLLGVSSIDSREYRRLKRSAIYKLADFLNLLIELDSKGK